jgi:hypothetical protein
MDTYYEAVACNENTLSFSSYSFSSPPSSSSSSFDDYFLMVCDVMYATKYVQTFKRSSLVPSSDDLLLMTVIFLAFVPLVPIQRFFFHPTIYECGFSGHHSCVIRQVLSCPSFMSTGVCKLVLSGFGNSPQQCCAIQERRYR